jgi:hypothetical protein
MRSLVALRLVLTALACRYTLLFHTVICSSLMKLYVTVTALCLAIVTDPIVRI